MIDGQMMFGDPVGLKLPDIHLTGEEKTLPRKLVSTVDRTRARCVTSAHATACSTVVDTAVYVFQLSIPLTVLIHPIEHNEI